MSNYFVNSFTDRIDGGNPAAVCVTDKWPDDSVMLDIAARNGLSETAFCIGYPESPDSEPRTSALQASVSQVSGRAAHNTARNTTRNTMQITCRPRHHIRRYHIRWFTPLCEVSLCGHATLAAAAVLFRFFHADAEQILFHSRSGILGVTKKSDLYELDFPAHSRRVIYRDGKFVGNSDADRTLAEKTLAALGAKCDREYEPLEIFVSCDAVAVLGTEAAVRRFVPRYDAVSDLSSGENSYIEGLIITSEADSTASQGAGYDFVSRCFYPTEGIPEDPVTGSAHSTLVPYWAAKSGRRELKACQASARGGELFCSYTGERVLISGKVFILP